MKDFLENLAKHEEEKVSQELKDPRERILIYSGVRLNWVGDYFGNPKIKWEEKELSIEKVEPTGINPGFKEVKQFQELIKSDPQVKEKYSKIASFGDEPILARKSDKEGNYKVLDGMHRFIGAVLSNKRTIKVMLPINEGDVLPICEPHVVYDLIRGFQRHAKDEKGKEELFHALKLLMRTYENVEDLLKNRFNKDWVKDNDVQEVIEKVIEGKYVR